MHCYKCWETKFFFSKRDFLSRTQFYQNPLQIPLPCYHSPQHCPSFTVYIFFVTFMGGNLQSNIVASLLFTKSSAAETVLCYQAAAVNHYCCSVNDFIASQSLTQKKTKMDSLKIVFKVHLACRCHGQKMSSTRIMLRVIVAVLVQLQQKQLSTVHDPFFYFHDKLSGCDPFFKVQAILK